MTFRKGIVFGLVALLGAGMAACDDDEDDDDGMQPRPEVFTANLTGQAEVPPVQTSATGTARVEFTPTGLTYTVNVTNITGVTTGGAHIHGPASATGTAGVILGLNPNNTVTSGLLATGTATATTSPTVSMDSLKKLIRAGQTYVNIHTSANPAGHIRGQLMPGN